MSYTILIGKAVLGPMDESGNAMPTWQVIRHEEADAPTFPHDEMTGHSNRRCPSYAGWKEFLHMVGLESLFNNPKNGLMRQHPGCFRLNEDDFLDIDSALELYVDHHPTHTPGFESIPESLGLEVAPIAYDGWLARLQWLHWWVRWALDHCKVPSIYNT